MVNLCVEKLSEGLKTNTEPLEDKEYKLFTELSESQKLKMELIEAIRHASDRKSVVPPEKRVGIPLR